MGLLGRIFGKKEDKKEKTTKTSKKSENANQINQQSRLNDILRWQTMEFVLGYEIHRGKREKLDQCCVCEKLAGKYPKSFIWTGWHDGCICYVTPIFQDKESSNRQDISDLRAALYGLPKIKIPVEQIEYLPKHFMDWYLENKDKDEYKNADFITRNHELIEESELHYYINSITDRL